MNVPSKLLEIMTPLSHQPLTKYLGYSVNTVNVANVQMIFINP